MTVEEIRATAGPVLLIAQIVASYTKTPRDDAAVSLLKKIIANDEIMAEVVKLIGKEDATVPVPPNPF